MSKEKNGRSAGMHVGSASIVMIFAITVSDGVFYVIFCNRQP